MILEETRSPLSVTVSAPEPPNCPWPSLKVTFMARSTNATASSHAWRQLGRFDIGETEARSETGIDRILGVLVVDEREVADEPEVEVAHDAVEVLADDAADDQLVVDAQVEEKAGRLLVDVDLARLVGQRD